MSTSDNKSNTDSPQESQDDISVWNLIDSDPDIFTDMIWGYGMRDVFAEDIKTLTDISKLPEYSAYGVIHGFKCNKDQSPVDRDEPDEDSEGICFSHQIAVNSCATHSLVNILINADINKDGLIQEFTDRTRNMNSIERGFAIKESESFRSIHNSYESPESENPDAILGGSQQYDDEDISHFVSYIFKNGFIWKLDSLNINPTKVMKVENEERWPKVLEHILVEKVGSGYSSNTFLAIKKDRIAEIEETLADMVLCEHNLGAQLKEMITAIYETNIFAILHPSALNPKINMTYDDREITREIITIKEKHLDILKYEMVERISRIEKLEKTLSPTHSSTEAFANKSEADSTELQDSFETCTAKDKSKKKKRSKPKDESSEPEEKGTKKRKRNDNNEGKDSKKPTKKQKHPRE